MQTSVLGQKVKDQYKKYSFVRILKLRKIKWAKSHAIVFPLILDKNLYYRRLSLTRFFL